ncbi:MAG: DUF1631 family protein [Thermomonas sp.]
MTPATPSTGAQAPQRLASAAVPRKVRVILDHVMDVASDELERQLQAMLSELEQQLFRLADHARNPGIESEYLHTLRTLRLNRSDLVPRFMIGLESSLATLGQSVAPILHQPAAWTGGSHNLSLIEDSEMDEATVLRDIASRHSSRSSLALHLLGQRFGVLAAAPALDVERLPCGPHSLCSILRDAVEALQLPMDARLLLYRTFDRQVMAEHERLVEMINATMAADGLLPALRYVPTRMRAPSSVAASTRDKREPQQQRAALAPQSQSQAQSPSQDPSEAKRKDGAAKDASQRRKASAARDPQRPHTGWLGVADPAGMQAEDTAAFELLQQLLAGRRELLGKFRSSAPQAPLQMLERNEVLAALPQQLPATGPGAQASVADIKQDLLARMRQQRGKGATLSSEDNDTFELLGMLYGQIEREIRTDAPAAPLLKQLQVPLVRLSLQDRGFFVREDHPARLLLNTVAESGARWLDRDDVDPQMLPAMQDAVQHVVKNYRDDAQVFAAANDDLQGRLRTIAHKAELAERRHIEAARGKEKLEVAKRRAIDTITELVGDQRPPHFVRALLNQAWADVLTLTLLRHGAESDEWKRKTETTRQIVENCCRGGQHAPDHALAEGIEAALSQVGYHSEEAAAIARRLASATDDDENDPASRTELAMKLKARARLGEEIASSRKKQMAPRTQDEQARYEYLRQLPYGTWIEFTTNQQGDAVRRRLSWYSTVTDNALFVNQRGQRVAEQTLDSLARLMASGQVRVVTAERARLIDRAWHATLNALRSFAGRSPSPAGEPA